MKDGNVFGAPESKVYDANRMPVWLEVKERKIAGGTIDLSVFAKGTLIPLGVPVYLPKMGGTAVILDVFKVDGAVTAESTAIKLKDGALGTKPKKGMIIGKANASGAISKAAALGTFTEGTGFAITANSLGALSDGDEVVFATAAGSSKSAILPSGLSWRQIYVDGEGQTGTVAVVTKGQILGDRIPAIPELFKSALTGITFEYEL